MIRIENRCGGCAPSFPCLGSSCPSRNAEIAYCDECGEEIKGDAYEIDGEDLCEECRDKVINEKGEE